MSVNDGGPAFPCDVSAPSEQMKYVLTGMSLRDWFAGQALAASGSWNLSTEDIAKRCYLDADAMLAERAKRDDHCKGDDT